VRVLDLGRIWDGWCLAKRQKLLRIIALTRGRDDGSVGNNQDGLLVLLLKVLLNEGADLSVGAVGSVGDSNQEVLGSGAIGLLVVNSLDAVNKDDLQMCLDSLVVELQLVERFGNLFLEISWLGSVLLDYFVSSIEHLCYSC